MAVEVCEVCGAKTANIELHHIIPTSYGGPKDGKLVKLCSNCHRDIHRQAESISAKDEEKRKRRFIREEHWDRALPFIRAIVLAKATNDSDEKKQKVKRKVMLSLDHDILVKLHKLKLDNGYKNLQLYLEDVIKNMVSKL